MKRYAEYKDSKIEWIGEIPHEWGIEKVKYRFKVINGATPKSSEESFWDGSIMWITPADYKTEDMYIRESRRCITEEGLDSCGTTLVPAESIIISNRAPIGSVGIASNELCTSQGCKALVKYGNVDGKYIFYFLSVMSDPLNMLGRGTTFLELSSTDMANFQFPLPSIRSQQRIVDYLEHKTSAIDLVIADKQKMIELLKEKRNSVISEAVTKGLDTTVPMKDSGIDWIGEIPDHWGMSKSEWLFSQRKDRAYDGDEQLTASQQQGIVYQKDYMAQGTRVVQVLKGADILKHVEVNDFVISMRSFQGGIEWSGLSGKISSAYVMLIPNAKYVYPPFFRWLLKSARYIVALQSTSNLVRDGQALRYDNFRMVDLPVIPLVEQKQIAEQLDIRVDRIDTLCSDIKEQVEKLKEYRQAIISEAVTGKVAV